MPRYGRVVEIIGIDHVQLAAPPGSEPEARRFYGEVLGLLELAKPEPLRRRGGVWFALGPEHQLHVGIQQPFAPSLKAHPALRVAGGTLDGLAARLSSAGSDVVWDEALPGSRRFYTADPWGNRLELVEPTSVQAPD